VPESGTTTIDRLCSLDVHHTEISRQREDGLHERDTSRTPAPRARRCAFLSPSHPGIVSRVPTQRVSPVDVALARVREICFAFPGTAEKLSHGAPAFFIRGKMFASFADDHHGDGRVALWCKSTKSEQQRRVEAAPERFFVPPYVGVSGWVGVRVDGSNTDWDEVAIVVEEAWVSAAPASAANDPIKPPPRAKPLAKTDPSVAKAALDRLVAICDALAESTCERSKRHATFRVRKKPYAYLLDNHDRDGVVAASWKATMADQASLLASDPTRFYAPPYIGPRGWTALRLDVGRVDWEELAQRIAASHALVSPTRSKPSKASTLGKARKASKRNEPSR